MTKRILYFSLFTNFILGIIKIIGGYFTFSKTLISDGVHSLTDMLTDIVSIFGSHLSNKKADENHPFGHGKIEYLTSILMSILIIILGIDMFIHSFRGEFNKVSIYALVIILITIVIKFILAYSLIYYGKRYNSEIVITNGIESKCDAISSLIGVIFIILNIVNNKLFKYSDSIGGAIISIFTILVGIKLLIKNSKSVIGEKEDNIDRIKNIEDIIYSNKYIKNIKYLTILKFGHYDQLLLELEVSKSLTVSKISNIENDIKKRIKEYDKYIKYIIINVRPYNKSLNK